MRTKKERIIERIKSSKELSKKLEEIAYFDHYDFYDHAMRYIKAVKEGRMMCKIESVSSSGMSRSLRFFEMDGTKNDGFRVYNFWSLFLALGFSRVKNSDCFRVYGCGMDMVFHTNYTNMHAFMRLGFLSKKECATLAQRTPHVV